MYLISVSQYIALGFLTRKCNVVCERTCVPLSYDNHPVVANTVVPGFRVLGFSVLPGFRALKSGDGAWSVHKTLFGFEAPILGS